MKDAEFFARMPVFTYREYADGVGGASRRSQKTIETQLRYHVRAGHLVRLRRGLYATVPPTADTASLAGVIKNPVEKYQQKTACSQKIQ